MNPLDLPGPAFLVFYVFTAVAAVIVAAVLRSRLRKPSDMPETLPHESACAIAYLAGGRKRAVHAAVARLVHEKCLTLGAATGTLTVNGPLPTDTELLEQAAYRKVSRRNVRELSELYGALTDETDAIHTQLKRDGLLLSTSQALAVRTWPTLVMVLVLLLGVAKLAVGIEREKPVSILIGLLVILCVPLIGFAWEPFRTRRGDRLLAKLRQDNSALQTSAQRRPEGLPAAELSLALGLFGVGVLTHESLAGMRQRMTPTSSNDSGGGGGGCGGGGGGGGGGCGGGGCGGCGGG